MMSRVKNSFLPPSALFPILHQVLLSLSPLEKGNVASSDLQPTGNLCSRGLVREAKFIKAILEASETALSLCPLAPTSSISLGMLRMDVQYNSTGDPL